MLIDWFTVAAQIVNFLILVYLLKRFLFRPIVRHMREREDNIRHRLEEAAQKREEADAMIADYRSRKEELDQRQQDTLEQAEQDAQERKHKLVEEARRDIEQKRKAWLQQLRKDQERFARNLRERAGRGVLEVARHAVQDLADESLNNRLGDALITRLGKIDQDDREKLSGCGQEGLLVCSTFALEASRKRRITAALHEICGKQADVVYEVQSDLPLGVEVRTGTMKLSWGIEGYLEQLRSRVMALVQEQTVQAGGESRGQEQVEEKPA